MGKSPKLAGFVQHGCVFQENLSSNQAIGQCPFCGKEKKFYVNVETQLWDCKVCMKRGNFPQFLALRMEAYTKAFKGTSVKTLAKDRGLKPQTLRAWGVGRAPQFFAIPVGNPMTDIHRYTLGGKKLNTSGSKQSIMSPVNPGMDSPVAWIAEGDWDGMALYECLRSEGETDRVYAVPGAGTFPKSAADLFFNKTVNLVFDHDTAGLRGMERIGNLLQGVASVRYLRWPSGTQDGFDFRDLYQREGSTKALAFVRSNLGDTLGESSTPEVETPSETPTGTGLTRNEVIAGYREWLHLTNVEPIDIIYGSIFANRIGGDPLWLFLVGPPGASKSEFLMSLDEAPKIYCITSITPHTLVSGANFGGGGDPSLIPRLNGKVLVIKDFTTILSMNQTAREEIFGVLRDSYDGKIAREYGNGVRRRYKSSYGILAGVTNSIEEYHSTHAVLGERFLKYKIRLVGKINVGRNIIRQSLMNVTKEFKMRAHLQTVASRCLSRSVGPEDVGEITEDIADRLTKVAQWVASLRGVVSRERYTDRIRYRPVAELGTRLAKQLAILGLGIAVFRGDNHITESIYRILVRVAKDTAPDCAEEIIHQMFIHRGKDPMTAQEISEWSRIPSGTVGPRLEDLNLLHIVEKIGDRQVQREWKLSPAMFRLTREIGIYEEDVQWRKSTSG